MQAADHVFDVAITIGGQIFPSLPTSPNLLSSHSKFELFETVVATGEPVTDACAVSGTVTVSGAPANNPVTIAVGDVFDLVFDACNDGNGYSIDGRFSLKVMELVGDPRNRRLSTKIRIAGHEPYCRFWRGQLHSVRHGISSCVGQPCLSGDRTEHLYPSLLCSLVMRRTFIHGLLG